MKEDGGGALRRFVDDRDGERVPEQSAGFGPLAGAAEVLGQREVHGRRAETHGEAQLQGLKAHRPGQAQRQEPREEVKRGREWRTPKRRGSCVLDVVDP